jgi:hypothetical protein
MPFALALTACSLFTSLDGLSAGGDPKTDAAGVGASGQEGTPGRDGLDATLAGDSPSSQTDATQTDPTAGISPFCHIVGGAHQYCWDFDEADPLASLGAGASGGGAVGVDTNFFVSPARSYLVSYVGGDSYATFAQALTGIANSITFEGSIRPSPDTTDIRMIAVQMSSTEWIHMNRIGGKLLLDDSKPLPDGGYVDTLSPALDFPAGQWTRVRIEMVPTKATLTIGGAQATVGLATWVDSANFIIGMAFIGSGTGSLDYDNLTLDVH